jgi:nucleoside-diphosphate-sugar epimerase
MDECVAVLGATSQLGACLLESLGQSRKRVVAFSRQAHKQTNEHVEWYRLGLDASTKNIGSVSNWICAAPIWVLPEYFALLEALGVKKLVSISSTSRFTKLDSIDPADQVVVHRLVDSERRVQKWAEEQGIEWIIFRPTMIYGLGTDKNVTEIACFISRWSFFPILGQADGLRQPIHVKDLAQACVVAMDSPVGKNRAYDVSGAETLPYREMVKRIFVALGKKPRIVVLPRWCFRCALPGLNLIPRFRNWSVAMVDRMERDMVFDNSEARDTFGFDPRPFTLDSNDLPESCRK